MASTSGYTQCACRDCLDDTVSSDMSDPDLCSICKDSGCDRELDDGGECQRIDQFDDIGFDANADATAVVETMLL